MFNKNKYHRNGRFFFALISMVSVVSASLGFFYNPESALAAPSTLIRITQVADTEGIPNGEASITTEISPDGRYTVYSSLANNLVAGDTNSQEDIFIHDSQTNDTERVSVDSNEVQGNGVSGDNAPETLDVSADGRYVVFLSRATNLVAGDTNGVTDVFVRDRQLGTTERVSVDSNENEITDQTGSPDISDDGRYVVFDSVSPDLVAGDVNGSIDIFLRDRTLGTTERISVDSSEVEADASSQSPAISGDGSAICFHSTATNLIAGDSNNETDIFVRNRVAGTTERVSIDSAEAQVNGSSSNCNISTDGSIVVFDSQATNLVASDTNADSDAFVRNRTTGNTFRASVDSVGTEHNGTSIGSVHISGNGRYVTFTSNATNLVASDTNAVQDVFMHDLVGSTTVRLSLGVGNPTRDLESNGFSYRTSASSNTGAKVAFTSAATNLITVSDNSGVDVFVRTSSGVVGSRDTVRLQADGDYEPYFGGNNASSTSAVSDSGHYVVFETYANNLGITDSNGARDIYLYDTVSPSLDLVSVDSSETQGNADSFSPSVDTTGELVVFGSGADNLVSSDGNGFTDIFLRDMNAGTTVKISNSTSDGDADSQSYSPSITPNGRYIIYTSEASNLVAGDTNGVSDIFVYDRVLDTTEMVSTQANGDLADQNSVLPSIRDDGRFVSFTSYSDILVGDDTNLVPDVFVKDRQTGAITRASVDSSEAEKPNGSSAGQIAGDGDFVVFTTTDDFVPEDTNFNNDIYRRDLVNGTTELISVSSNEDIGDGNSTVPTITFDGQYVTFESTSENLVGDDTNFTNDIFRRNVNSGTTERVSVTSSNVQGSGRVPFMNAQSGQITFVSNSASLVTNGTISNDDLFLANYGTFLSAQPSLITAPATSVSDTQATLNAEITFVGINAVTERGFEYGTTTAYGSTVSDTGSFSEGQYSKVASLTCNTTYHYRAYASTTFGTEYGNDFIVTTDACGSSTPPTVTTTGESAITTTGATLGGNITALGTATPTTRGFELGTTLSYGTTFSASGSFSTGAYTLPATGLTCNTMYHYRAFATSADGTGNGADDTFTTSACASGGGSSSGSTSGSGSANSPHSNGTLILDGSTIYLIKDGQRFGFRDPEEYRSYGYNFNQAVPISQRDRTLPASANALKAMVGTMVLDKSDNRTVYMIGLNNTKRGFVSEPVYFQAGYNYNTLFRVDLSDYGVGAIIDNPYAAHPEGSLVREANGTVWWLLGQYRQGFESEQVFYTYGFTFSRLVTINSADLQVPIGPLVKFRDGTLVQDGGKHYIISDGKKLEFESTQALQAWGYKLSNVIAASLINYEAGKKLKQ